MIRVSDEEWDRSVQDFISLRNKAQETVEARFKETEGMEAPPFVWWGYRDCFQKKLSTHFPEDQLTTCATYHALIGGTPRQGTTSRWDFEGDESVVGFLERTVQGHFDFPVALPKAFAAALAGPRTGKKASPS